MSKSLISLLFLFAIGQGILLCIIALRQTKMRQANRLLSASLLLFVLMISHSWLGIQDLYRVYPHTEAAIATLALLVGPLLLLYLRSVLLGVTLSVRDSWHTFPFILSLILWMPYYFQSAETKYTLMLTQQRLPVHLIVFAICKVTHLLVYLLLSLRLIQKVRASRPEQQFSRQLHRLSMLLTLGILLHLALFGLERLNPSWPEFSDIVGAMTLTMFVYGLAIMSMRLPEGYQPEALPTPASPRYVNNLISSEQRQIFLTRLIDSMEREQLFRNGELKLEELAEHLAMTAHELSQLINEACAVNFQEYLNHFRVEALKLSLLDPEQQNATILELALAAGFNSKSSLNRTFKKHTGSTPSEWRAGKIE